MNGCCSATVLVNETVANTVSCLCCAETKEVYGGAKCNGELLLSAGTDGIILERRSDHVLMIKTLTAKLGRPRWKQLSGFRTDMRERR